jgi:hypothetical protein
MVSIECHDNKLLRPGIVICWHFQAICDLIREGETKITGPGRDAIDLVDRRRNCPRHNKRTRTVREIFSIDETCVQPASTHSPPAISFNQARGKKCNGNREPNSAFCVNLSE